MSEDSSIRVEAHRVAFDMVNGETITLPARYGQFHDEEGIVLPKCEIFFGPFKKTRERVEMRRVHRRYFGSDHKAVLAELPNIPMDGWKKIGEVKTIYYVRRGTRAPGGYHHGYQRRGSGFWTWRTPGRHPTLSENGKIYKLSLGSGCLVDDRGYRYP